MQGSGLERVVALSTYGAQSGDHIGDLGVLYEMEQALAAQPIPTTIIRAAYYMSNWDFALPSVLENAEVPSFYPAEFRLPMVAPQDIGQLAARLMTDAVENTGLHFIEGPELYSPADVASAFSVSLKKSVKVMEIPREQWLTALQAVGFSEKAAKSMCAMTTLTLEGLSPTPDSPERGTTSLHNYISNIAHNQAHHSQ
jgi:uncharacterized protein YbjT (DUF2867 family)